MSEEITLDKIEEMEKRITELEGTQEQLNIYINELQKGNEFLRDTLHTINQKEKENTILKQRIQQHKK